MVTVLDASGRMRDHWWWRPGWRVGRRMYTWHATFEEQSALHKLAKRYQTVLSALPGLDIIPLPWLHLTIQGVGFTDEVTPEDLQSIVAAVRDRLRRRRPVTFQVQSPIVDPEAIMVRAEPVDELQQIRSDIRAGIAEIWGDAHVPDPPQWTPHISIAYSNTEGSAKPYVEAVSSIAAEQAIITLVDIKLIRIGRDTRLYQWKTAAAVPLGDSQEAKIEAEQQGSV